MKKLTFMGIGPRIGGVALPWLAVAIFLSLWYKNAFVFIPGGSRALLIIGIVFTVAGALMYFATVPALLSGLKNTKLMTGGTYFLCCNPLYASVILLIIPGVSFMMNSWLVLTTSIVAYLIFKTSIRKEYQEMEVFFGDDFKHYRSSTPEIMPLPFKKWFTASRD